MRVAGYLHAVHDRRIGIGLRYVGQGLGKEAARQLLVVEPRLVEKAVEGAPVAIGEAQGDERLGDGAAGEAEEVAQQQSPHAVEGALLAEGRAVRRKQAPERGKQGRRRRFGERSCCGVLGQGSDLPFGRGGRPPRKPPSERIAVLPGGGRAFLPQEERCGFRAEVLGQPAPQILEDAPGQPGFQATQDLRDEED